MESLAELSLTATPEFSRRLSINRRRLGCLQSSGAIAGKFSRVKRLPHVQGFEPFERVG
jgi:hypothetical protein